MQNLLFRLTEYRPICIMSCLLGDELTPEADFYAGEQSVACVMKRVYLGVG